MMTAKSCCFIHAQDKNIDINNKTAKKKRLEFSRCFGRTSRPSSGDLMTACPSKISGKLQSLFSLLFHYLEINTFSMSFLNFNFEIAGQKLEGIQRHFHIQV